MDFDLERLKTFYYVVKSGGFSKASSVLNISQPALSRSVKLFEDRLNTKLMKRSTKGLKLTPEGEKIFAFAHRVTYEAETLRKMLSDHYTEPQGEVTIITTPHMGSSWLMSFLPGFSRVYPKIDITIVGRMERIDVTEADVAICPFIPHQTGLIQRKLKSFPMGLWACPSYLKEFGIPKNVDELNQHKIIAYGENIVSPYGNCSWILEVGMNPPYLRKPFLKVNNLEGLVNAAKGGLGIAELSDEWPSVKESKLVRVLPDVNGPIVDLYYIYKDSMKNSKRITALGDYLEQQLKTL